MTPPIAVSFRKTKFHAMEGEFWVKDNTNPKGRKGKCRVTLLDYSSNEVILQIVTLKSGSDQEVENKVFVPENWLVCFAETKDQVASMALIKTSALNETIVFEVRHENMAILKLMELKLREFLKVISYDVLIKGAPPNNKPSPGIIHIFRDKILVTQGFPPNFKNILCYSLQSGDNGVKPVDEMGLCFPGVVVLSEHRDDIWKTLQGCIRAIRYCTTKAATPTITSDVTTTTATALPGYRQQLSTSKEKQDDRVYHNLSRPCRYIYMNMPDNSRAPFKSHNYVNVFSLSGTIYQNWQNCSGTDHESRSPPPLPPPRRPAPPRPPKPRNRPPNSPLPPIPPPSVGQSDHSPPPLPAPRLSKEFREKEMQYVVYASKPVVGQFWVIQVVFLQSNDHVTLMRIKKLEEESNCQLLKPLPEYIKVTSDFKISLFETESGCTLKSDRDQVVEYEVVKEAVLQSCWMVIEFHLEHNEHMKRNFHAKIVVQPLVPSETSMVKKDILISTNFQVLDQLQQNMIHTNASYCNSLKSIGVRKYLELISLLDVPCALHNDWTGLAGEVGLTVDEVFKIQSKACFPNYSPTNEVLNIWSQKDRMCNIDELKNILQKLQRFDALSILENADS